MINPAPRKRHPLKQGPLEWTERNRSQRRDFLRSHGTRAQRLVAGFGNLRRSRAA